jgi:outer membrane protein assembly factor BamE (lipoprotein component of BamABCDE complex)
MKTLFSIAVLGIYGVSGCSIPGSQYASAHPELSQTHRQILSTGEIPAGTAVAGMPKEQIRLVLGKPKRFEKFNGQDAWVYIKETGFPFVGNSQYNPESDIINLGDMGDCPMIERTTTIFFKGDRATLAQITQGQQ